MARPFCDFPSEPIGREIFLGWRIATRDNFQHRFLELQDELYKAAGVPEVVAIGEYKNMADALHARGEPQVWVLSLLPDDKERELTEFVSANWTSRKIVWDGSDLTQGIEERLFWASHADLKVGRHQVIREAILCYENLKQAFEDYKVMGALISNEWMHIQRTVALLCKKYGVPYVHDEQGYLPHTRKIDPDGLEGTSCFTDKVWKKLVRQGMSPEEYAQTVEALRELNRRSEIVIPVGKEMSPQEIYRKYKLDPKKPVIVIPAQIDSDSNVLRWSHQFPRNLDVIRATIPLFDKANVIFKMHPLRESLSSFIERINIAFPEVKVASEVSLASIFKVTDLLVTRTSTCGVEALVKNIPVITLGDCNYANRGVTVEARSKQQLCQAVTKTLSQIKAGKFWTESRSYKRLLLFKYLFMDYLFWSKAHEPVEGFHEMSVARFRKLLKLNGRKL